MRVILIGSASQRAILRERAERAGLLVAGEARSLADAVMSRITADAVLSAPPDAHDDLEYREELTPRESEVLDLLAEGLSNKAIAERLGISDQTVKFHIAGLSGKLGASNRTTAVRLAIERGLVIL